MRMERCDFWRCSNRECGCEILVVAAAKFDGRSNPICVCGAAMKKPYVKPAMQKSGAKASGRLPNVYALEMT